jgi:hypothetical protein
MTAGTPVISLSFDPISQFRRSSSEEGRWGFGTELGRRDRRSGAAAFRYQAAGRCSIRCFLHNSHRSAHTPVAHYSSVAVVFQNLDCIELARDLSLQPSLCRNMVVYRQDVYGGR